MDRNAESLTYRVDEVQHMLRVSRSVVYACLHTGIIPHLRLGKRYVIPRVAFHRWLEESPWAKIISKDKYSSLAEKMKQDSVE